MQNQNHQHRRFLWSMARYEAMLRRKYFVQSMNFRRAVAAREDFDGVISGYLAHRHREMLQTLLEDHYRQVISHFGKLSLRAIKSFRISRKQEQNIFEALIAEWITTQGLEKATRISETDIDVLRTVIDKAVEEGEGTEAIGRALRNARPFDIARAAMIARTETHAAATYGSIQSVRQAEDEFGIVMLKKWSPTMDQRTREEHAAMRSKPAIPLDEKFNVGGEMMDRPGDPAGSAWNVIHCRCALIYEEKLDDE